MLLKKKNRFLKDSTERVQLTWYLKKKKPKKNAKTYNMVTTVIRYHWLPTLRTCTNFHSSLICIKCQSFQSFIKLLFFLHMYMYRIFKKGFCSTCTVFEFLVRMAIYFYIVHSVFKTQNPVCAGYKIKWTIMFSLMWKYQIDFHMYLFIFSVFNNHFVK